jgi:hypothetical protein
MNELFQADLLALLITKRYVKGNDLAQFLIDPDPGLIFLLLYMGMNATL